MGYSVFILVAVFGGLGFFYFRMYQKGKAAGAGGGIAAGLAQGALEAEKARWGSVLEGDEQVTIRGYGVEMLPWWKGMLREHFPIFRSVFKAVNYEFIVTTKSRILMMKTESGVMLSSTGPVTTMTLADIEVTRMEQQKVSSITQMTSNAMGGGEVRTFSLSMKVKSSEKALELANVNGDFADFVSTRMSAAQKAA